MEKILIFILVGDNGPSRKTITEQLQRAAKTIVISTDFRPDDADEKERVERGGIAWDKLSEHERQRKREIVAVRKILNASNEQFIVDRPTLSQEEIFIYNFLNSECAITTVRISESFIRKDLNRGTIVFMNGEDIHLRQQLKKGSPGAYVLDKDRLHEIDSDVKASVQPNQEQVTENHEEIKTWRRDKAFQDELAKGTNLIMIDQRLLTESEMEFYRYMGKINSYGNLTLTSMKFNPQLLEMKFSNTDDFNSKAAADEAEKQESWKERYLPEKIRGWKVWNWKKVAAI